MAIPHDVLNDPLFRMLSDWMLQQTIENAGKNENKKSKPDERNTLKLRGHLSDDGADNSSDVKN